MKVTSEKMSDESLVSMKRKAMEDISSRTSKVIREILCDMHKQRHRINKGTGQALYQERKKRYPANPKAKNDVCDALAVVDAKPTK